MPQCVQWLTKPFESGRIEFILDAYRRQQEKLLKEYAKETSEIETPAASMQKYLEKLEQERQNYIQAAFETLQNAADLDLRNFFEPLTSAIDLAFENEPTEDVRKNPAALQWAISRYRTDPRRASYVRACQYFLDRHQKPTPAGIPQGMVALPQKEKKRR